MKEIKINKILYEPKTQFGDEISIYGEKYHQIIIDPNLFVVETNDSISKENKDLKFEFDRMLYKLYDIDPFTKNGLTFVECRRWEISVVEELSAKQILEKYRISRRTLSNWVKSKKINTKKTETGRYIYLDCQ